jgi:hypothetical protein
VASALCVQSGEADTEAESVDAVGCALGLAAGSTGSGRGSGSWVTSASPGAASPGAASPGAARASGVGGAAASTGFGLTSGLGKRFASRLGAPWLTLSGFRASIAQTRVRHALLRGTTVDRGTQKPLGAPGIACARFGAVGRSGHVREAEVLGSPAFLGGLARLT